MVPVARVWNKVLPLYQLDASVIVAPSSDG